VSGFSRTVTSAQKPEMTRVPRFENDRAVSWKSVIPPHTESTLHRHDRYRTVIGIVGGDLTTVDPQGKKTVTHYETGGAYWQEPMPAGAMHKDVNETGKTIELVVVEEKAIAPTAFEDHYADVNGVRLHYASAGTGPLVLFLHGYPSFWYQWKDQITEMSRDHLAVGLDMRGYNLSSRPEGLEPYTMKHLVEDVRQFAEKVGGKDRKFVLVAHDWGANVAWVFAMYHPEMLEKLVIVNGAHPFISERELRDNPAQRYASNYFFVFNKFLAPGEQPVDESTTKETATRRAHTGFVDAEVKAGRYTEADRQMWIDAWSQPGSTTAGLNYYRANHRNPPFNDRHPASTIPTSWSAKEVTAGAKSTIIKTPTLVIWGMKDTAILSSHLSGLDKWVTDLRVKLYPDDDHWVMLEKHTAVAQDIRRFIDDKDFPKESVYR
jgi:pimeloyl-ACP methyl ester carboxylesterase